VDAPAVKKKKGNNMATINHNKGYKGYFRVFSWDQLATIRDLKTC
jgi:hypothetical protein